VIQVIVVKGAFRWDLVGLERPYKLQSYLFLNWVANQWTRCYIHIHGLSHYTKIWGYTRIDGSMPEIWTEENELRV